MNTKPQKKTYKDLLDLLQTMPPERLADPIVWSGEERGGYVYKFWQAPEDWHYSDEGLERHAEVIQQTMEEDDLTEEAARKAVGPPLYPAGALLLEVDPS